MVGPPSLTDLPEEALLRPSRCGLAPPGGTTKRGPPSVTGNLSQWHPRLGVARRERWGRPDRNRVPGATGPA
jgi:hypothetical protein